MVGKISYLPLFNLSVKIICDCQIDDVTRGTRDVECEWVTPLLTY